MPRPASWRAACWRRPGHAAHGRTRWSDREELRVCLLRLRKEQRAGAALTDLQALISAASRDPDQTDINELERQFQVLHLEREQLEQAINPAAVVAGAEEE